MSYRRRLLDDELDQLLPYLAAIAIEGAKGVGKTATALERANSSLDLTRQRQRDIIAVDPDRTLNRPAPLLIDEWQLVPEVWESVKRQVDADTSGGQFILTGSAGPKRGVRIHSGAGRIARLMLRPLALPERELCDPTVSLGTLLTGQRPNFVGQSQIDLRTYTEEILRSGFPGIRDLPDRARRVQLDTYLTRVVDHDLPEGGVAVRRPAALLAWLTAYAAATATTASANTILDAATPGQGEKPVRQTVAGYREQLVRQFLLDPVEAWVPSLSPLKRLTMASKHHLVDPALAARLIGVSAAGLLQGEGDHLGPRDGTLLGALFESLATQTVRALAEHAHASTFHLRTKDGSHEVDLIVEGDDRRVVAFEVKLNPVVTDTEVKHLRWLHDQIGSRLADAAILTTGPAAYRRQDGIGVLPLALLGP